METNKEISMTCIVCPIGCALTLHVQGSTISAIEGNRCSRGEVYAKEEYLAPKRIVTATVRVEGGKQNRAPVKTSQPVAKAYIPRLLETLYALTFEAPIRCGQTLYQEESFSVVATGSVEIIHVS